jgi:hypothetical protein
MAVHPGIGATGTVHPHRAIGYGPESSLDFLLDGFDIWMELALPAVIPLAVVLYPAG